MIIPPCITSLLSHWWICVRPDPWYVSKNSTNDQKTSPHPVNESVHSSCFFFSLRWKNAGSSTFLFSSLWWPDQRCCFNININNNKNNKRKEKNKAMSLSLSVCLSFIICSIFRSMCACACVSVYLATLSLSLFKYLLHSSFSSCFFHSFLSLFFVYLYFERKNKQTITENRTSFWRFIVHWGTWKWHWSPSCSFHSSRDDDKVPLLSQSTE